MRIDPAKSIKGTALAIWPQLLGCRVRGQVRLRGARSQVQMQAGCMLRAGSRRGVGTFGCEVPAGCAKHVSRVCQACQQGVPSMSAGCAKHVSRVCQACQQGVPGMSAGCAKHVSRVCQACQPGVSCMQQGVSCMSAGCELRAGSRAEGRFGYVM